MDRTSVIYHGSSFPVSNTPPDDTIFEQPTFLYVGGRNTYKNFPFLLRAFAKAHQSCPKIRLLLAGPPLTADEKWQLYFLGIADLIMCIEFPTEEMLQRLYRASVALLYPSRFEGFGIPPLEAMAVGTLPIASNATSLPEVLGDAGVLLDPTDENLWADALIAVARQEIPRQALLARGTLRARLLTWQSSAEQHISLYKRLLP